MTTTERETIKEIGSSLRLARVAAGKSLPHVALLAGLGKGHLSTIERGARGDVGVVTIYRICRALDIHPRYVMPDFKKL